MLKSSGGIALIAIRKVSAGEVSYTSTKVY
jgi:hypothetical protein